MWTYRRRLSIHPRESYVSFAGERLLVAANGCVLSPISDELELKLRRAPQVFRFDPAIEAPAPKKAEPKSEEVAPPVENEPPAEAEPAKEQKVESSGKNDDNVTKRKRRSRKSSEG